MGLLLSIAVAILALGLALLWWSRRVQQETGLPAGELIYTDTGAWEAVREPLLSRRFGLVGRPDYLVRMGAGRRSMIIPVEVKSGPRPPQPSAGHMLQLGAYCLLVEDAHQQRPAFGILRYADATLKIPFTDALRREVLDAAGAIRAARRANDIPRSHKDPGRCRACGYRDGCGDQVLDRDRAG